MSAHIRLNHFISSANQCYSEPRHCLVADAHSTAVRSQPLSHGVGANVREENKRTWRIFKESLIGTIGEQKFEWICQRYRSQLNFNHLETSGRPLLPQHIELFSIGSHQVLSRDIKERFPGHLKLATRAQISERIHSAQPFPIVGSYVDPVRIPGPPSSLSAHIVHDKILMDKEKQLLFSDVEGLQFNAWVERFCKVTVNRELLEGQVIPAPGRDGRMDYYKIYRKIATGDGLIAYALKPAADDSTLEPIIIFRPSQFSVSNEDAFETYLNDVQPRVGEMGWVPSKPIFEQLMADAHFRRNKEKIGIAGYSLGGTHAQHFFSTFHADVSWFVTHNAPSLDDETAERVADVVNQTRKDPLSIQIFRTYGDFCHCVGGKHIGWGMNNPHVKVQLAEIDLENKSEMSAFRLHGFRIFDNKNFRYQMQLFETPDQLNERLDNSRRGPEIAWYEKMRSFSGGIAFFVLKLVAEFIKFLSSLLGIRILRSSRDPS